jgi:hypothetical protein
MLVLPRCRCEPLPRNTRGCAVECALNSSTAKYRVPIHPFSIRLRWNLRGRTSKSCKPIERFSHPYPSGVGLKNAFTVGSSCKNEHAEFRTTNFFRIQVISNFIVQPPNTNAAFLCRPCPTTLELAALWCANLAASLDQKPSTLLFIDSSSFCPRRNEQRSTGRHAQSGSPRRRGSRRRWHGRPGRADPRGRRVPLRRLRRAEPHQRRRSRSVPAVRLPDPVQDPDQAM